MASNFHGLKVSHFFVNYPWVTKILFTKISSQSAWLVDEAIMC